MKDEKHHLKHVQKRIIRSARKESEKEAKKEKIIEFNEAEKSTNVYDEVIPSDQQVPRVAGRHNYH